MTDATRRATIYFDSAVHKALKLKAEETSRSVSDLVNAAVKESLAEDAEDLAAFDENADEPLVGYDEMVKRLKRDAVRPPASCSRRLGDLPDIMRRLAHLSEDEAAALAEDLERARTEWPPESNADDEADT